MNECGFEDVHRHFWLQLLVVYFLFSLRTNKMSPQELNFLFSQKSHFVKEFSEIHCDA